MVIEKKVDAQVKKLSGEVMLKPMLFSMLNRDKFRLQEMETFSQPAKFKSIVQLDTLEGKYNSIRDRICTMNY